MFDESLNQTNKTKQLPACKLLGRCAGTVYVPGIPGMRNTTSQDLLKCVKESKCLNINGMQCLHAQTKKHDTSNQIRDSKVHANAVMDLVSRF